DLAKIGGPDLRGERPADFLRLDRKPEEVRFLNVDRAAQPRGQDEMAFQDCVAGPENIEDFFLSHLRPYSCQRERSQPITRSTEFTTGFALTWLRSLLR